MFTRVLGLQAPYAVSAWAGFRAHRDSFAARRDRLREVVAALTAAFPAAGASVLLRFDPPVPKVCGAEKPNASLRVHFHLLLLLPLPVKVCLVHVYVGAPLEAARAAAAAAAAATGVVCVQPDRLRSGRWGATGQTYFELTLGPANGAVSVETWLMGWHAFVARLHEGATAVP